MVEVIASDSKEIVPQSNIMDVVFILPVSEVEQGSFYMSGSKLIYFKRYCVTGNNIIQPCHPNAYFGKFYLEPFSIRLFHASNNLAQNLTRFLHHGPSSRLSMKTFRFFSGEALMFIHDKLATALRFEVEKKESRIVYYSTLQMEAKSTQLRKVYIMVGDKSSIPVLCDILGMGMGLGLAKKPPNKEKTIGVVYNRFYISFC